MIPFPDKRYSIIYADPPWKFSNKRTGGSLKSGSASQYSVMSLSDICALPIRDICEDDCILFLWWVASQPAEACEVIRSWGFTVKTMSGFNWIKTTSGDKPHFGMGFWTRAGSELCAIATRGKPKRASASVRSVLFHPVEAHSRKPGIIRRDIVKLCGDLPRIELFAREYCYGWDSWGDEIPVHEF